MEGVATCFRRVGGWLRRLWSWLFGRRPVKNQYAGCNLVVVNGRSRGQWREIKGNTEHTLTLAAPFDEAPASGDELAILVPGASGPGDTVAVTSHADDFDLN